MSQNLLCLLRLDVDRKVLLLVFALNWGGLLLGRLPGYIEDGESVYKVHMATPDEVLHGTVITWWRSENFGCRYDCDVQRSVEDEKVLKFLRERT